MQMVSSALENLALSPPPTPANTYLVEEVQRYKPAPEVYRGLLEKLGKTDAPQTVYLVSRYLYYYYCQGCTSRSHPAVIHLMWSVHEHPA
jgi:hypothetical protein